MSRQVPVYTKEPLALNATSTLANLDPIELGEGGYLGLEIHIHNGAGAAPSDTPVGSWLVHLSSDGKNFYPFTDDVFAAKLARSNASGNVKIDGFAAIRGLPGKFAKLQYVYGSGGLTSARAYVIATTEV